MFNKILENRSKWLLISLGIVYLWFGALKFFPGYSPAEDLAVETILALTFGQLSTQAAIILLAAWETIMGLCFLFGIRRKQTIQLAIIHLVFTFSVFILFPDKTFAIAPVSFTIVGQYIVKNLVFIAALLFLYPDEKKVSISS